MITVKDVLLEFDGGVLWPIKKRDSALTTTYKKLRLMLDRGENYFEGIFRIATVREGRIENSRDMAIMYQNKEILKDLIHKKHIYLTPTKLDVSRQGYRSPDNYWYVAILKKEGRVGYLVLIFDFERERCPISARSKKVYGGNFSLMEILADGTTILFNKTVSFEEVKNCKVNTTSLMNLFFNEEEIRLVGSVVDSIMSNQESTIGEAYVYYHKEGLIL